jgi:hypothetical protein
LYLAAAAGVSHERLLVLYPIFLRKLVIGPLLIRDPIGEETVPSNVMELRWEVSALPSGEEFEERRVYIRFAHRFQSRISTADERDERRWRRSRPEFRTGIDRMDGIRMDAGG